GTGRVIVGAEADVIGRLASIGGGSARTTQNRPVATTTTLTAPSTSRPSPTHASHRPARSPRPRCGAGRGGSWSSGIDHLHERVRRRARLTRRKSERSGYR